MVDGRVGQCGAPDASSFKILLNLKPFKWFQPQTFVPQIQMCRSRRFRRVPGRLKVLDMTRPLCPQLFEKSELLECIKKLVEVDQEWVPYSQDASLYIRPTFIGTEVRLAPSQTLTGPSRSGPPDALLCPPALPGGVPGWESHDIRHHRPSGALLRHRILQPGFSAG